MLCIVVIAVVSALALAQPMADVPLPFWRAAITGLAMFSVVSVAALATRVRCRAHDVEEREFEARTWDAMTLGTWALMALFCVQVMRWPSLVRLSMGERAFVVDELLILAALLSPLFLAWSILYVPADGLPFWRGLRERFEASWLRVRFALVLAVLPLILISGVSDALDIFYPSQSETGRTLVYVFFLVAMVVLFPVVMRTLWSVRPFRPNALRERLRKLASEHGVRLAAICEWDTGYRVANAFVAGVVAPLRYIFLTDGLLSELDDEQVELVFAHELGHVVKRHLLLRLLALVTPVSLYVLLTRGAALVFDQAAIDAGPVLTSGIELVVTTLSLLFFALALGWYSRQLEHEADAWACLQGIGGEAREHIASYEQALWRLADPTHWDRSGWLHPSYKQRCSFLHKHAAQTPLQHSFASRMRALAATLYMVNTSALLLLIYAL